MLPQEPGWFQSFEFFQVVSNAAVCVDFFLTRLLIRAQPKNKKRVMAVSAALQQFLNAKIICVSITFT